MQPKLLHFNTAVNLMLSLAEVLGILYQQLWGCQKYVDIVT